MEEGQATKEERVEKYTGRIYVVLKKVKDMESVINTQDDGLFKSICKILFSCCLDSSSLWHFRRAAEPSDINW